MGGDTWCIGRRRRRTRDRRKTMSLDYICLLRSHIETSRRLVGPSQIMQDICLVITCGLYTKDYVSHQCRLHLQIFNCFCLYLHLPLHTCDCPDVLRCLPLQLPNPGRLFLQLCVHLNLKTVNTQRCAWLHRVYENPMCCRGFVAATEPIASAIPTFEKLSVLFSSTLLKLMHATLIHKDPPWWVPVHCLGATAQEWETHSKKQNNHKKERHQFTVTVLSENVHDGTR